VAAAESAVVLAALDAQGYSVRDARFLVDLCGTRLRLLDGPLSRVESVVGAAEYVNTLRDTASAHFLMLFRGLSGNDTKVLADVLDACVEPIRDVDGRGDFPYLDHVPAAVLDRNISPVLHIDLGRELHFDSELYRCV
jgi:hypothetical protein